MANHRFSWTAHRGARALIAVAALAMVLLLGGCAERMDSALVVRPDGAWTGEVRLSFSSVPRGMLGGEAELDRKVEEQAAALLGENGVDYALSAAQDGAGRVYTLALGGQDLAAAGRILAGPGGGELLSGPGLVEVTGQVRAGETLEVALPANLSTGYGWAVDPAGSAAFFDLGVESKQVGSGDGSLARQVIRARAEQSGTATLRLAYRRPWQPETPTRVVTVGGGQARLADIAAAMSMSPPAAGPQPAKAAPPRAAEPAGPTPNLPTSYNWCDYGGCTPIKDQQSCGSCWAFGTVGVFESAIKLKTGTTADLSEQYLVSCNHDGFSCASGGNWSAHDYHWFEYYAPETTAGAVTESQYPYTATDAPCTGGPFGHPYQINSWTYVQPGDPYSIPPANVLKQAIYDHGPVGVSVCAGNAFSNYGGGVFTVDESSVCGGGTNHAVMLVGWNDADQTWILRNSWNTWWGESGYMRIRWGISSVGKKANYVVFNPAVPGDNWAYLPVVTRKYTGTGPTPPGGLPINEGFEGGAVPPTGWTRIQTNPRETWKVGLYPYAGTFSAEVWWDSAGPAYQDELLLTPAFTAGTAQLQFYSAGDTDWCRDVYDECDLDVWLVVGNWGGGDDTFLGRADSSWTGIFAWSPMSINLTPYLPNGTPVRVAFRYYSATGNGNDALIDQISITGSGLAFVAPEARRPDVRGARGVAR